MLAGSGSGCLAAMLPAKFEQFDIYTPRDLASRRASMASAGCLDSDLTDAWLSASEECVLKEVVGQSEGSLIDAQDHSVPMRRRLSSMRLRSSVRRRSSVMSNVSEAEQYLERDQQISALRETLHEQALLSEAGDQHADGCRQDQRVIYKEEQQISEFRGVVPEQKLFSQERSGFRDSSVAVSDQRCKAVVGVEFEACESRASGIHSESATGLDVRTQQQETNSGAGWLWGVFVGDCAATSSPTTADHYAVGHKEHQEWNTELYQLAKREEEDWLPLFWDRLTSWCCAREKSEEVNYVERLQLEIMAKRKLPQ